MNIILYKYNQLGDKAVKYAQSRENAVLNLLYSFENKTLLEALNITDNTSFWQYFGFCYNITTVEISVEKALELKAITHHDIQYYFCVENKIPCFLPEICKSCNSKTSDLYSVKELSDLHITECSNCGKSFL